MTWNHIQCYKNTFDVIQESQGAFGSKVDIKPQYCPQEAWFQPPARTSQHNFKIKSQKYNKSWWGYPGYQYFLTTLMMTMTIRTILWWRRWEKW